MALSVNRIEAATAIAGLTSLIACCLTGCMGMPGNQVTDAASVVYAKGALQDTIAVRLPVSPPEVYETIVRLIGAEPDMNIDSRNDASMLLEGTTADARYTVQATDLGAEETLLFVWLDTSASGRPAHEISVAAIERLCAELDVPCDVVDTK
jgi:hypothetical protein